MCPTMFMKQVGGILHRIWHIVVTIELQQLLNLQGLVLGGTTNQKPRILNIMNRDTQKTSSEQRNAKYLGENTTQRQVFRGEYNATPSI